MKLNRIIFALPVIAIAFAGNVDANTSSKDTIYGLDSRTKRYTAVGAGREKFDSKFYVGARFNYNLASFSNEYSVASDPADKFSDSFSFVQQPGFDAAVGYQFAPRWRMELNYINTGKYSDKDSGGNFDISSQLFMLNGIYAINMWTTTSLHVGLGLGAGMLTTKHTNIYFLPTANESKTSMGFAGQAMIGVEERISEQVYLGLTYKLSYITGHKQEIALDPITFGSADTFISETGGILNNTFGIGLRLEF